jgi:hypothetical protein
VPVTGLFRCVLDKRPSHATPAARFRNELEDYMPLLMRNLLRFLEPAQRQFPSDPYQACGYV